MERDASEAAEKLSKQNFTEDLYYILVEKCQAPEAITRIKAVPEGEGIKAAGGS